MYFYIDESGHTGTNLFDYLQPMLYYGVISSEVNLDILAEPYLLKLRNRLEVDRLHANELGNSNLVKVVSDLLHLNKKYKLKFDLYRVAKADHALISFFDQVFDQGNNPAFSWVGYWTPARYVFLLKVAYLFDEDTLKKAWTARIELNNKKAENGLIEVCKIIKGRAHFLPDKRSRQLITEALQCVIDNPEKIHYNIKSKKDLLLITPNVIGFQAVMMGIAQRTIKRKRQASKIIVDQQSQFNKAQKTLSDFYSALRDQIPFRIGPGLPEISFKGMPTIPITFSAAKDSAGLELVDIFLWIFKRQLEAKNLAGDLFVIVNKLNLRSSTNELSLDAINTRWSKWLDNLPQLNNLTEEKMKKVKKAMAIYEDRRLSAFKKFGK